jgi:hypothetical protein
MIPSSIKIGNIEYTIEKVNLPMVHNAQELSGQIDFRNTVIKIREDGFSENHQEETFWHEAMHAIIDREQLSFEDEELVCTSFARALHAMMQNNPFPLPGQASS